jgi:hypothetical protein
MTPNAWPAWMPPPPEGRDVGVRKPHISFARFSDGSLMFEVRHWPNWPQSTEGTSVAAGDDLADAWDAHMQKFEDDEDEDDGVIAT